MVPAFFLLPYTEAFEFRKQSKNSVSSAKRRVWDTHSKAFITHYYYFNTNRYENICMIFIAINLRPPLSLIAGARGTLSSPSSEPKLSEESRYWLSPIGTSSPHRRVTSEAIFATWPVDIAVTHSNSSVIDSPAYYNLLSLWTSHILSIKGNLTHRRLVLAGFP